MTISLVIIGLWVALQVWAHVMGRRWDREKAARLEARAAAEEERILTWLRDGRLAIDAETGDVVRPPRRAPLRADARAENPEAWRRGCSSSSLSSRPPA